jgi:aconitate hydratase
VLRNLRREEVTEDHVPRAPPGVGASAARTDEIPFVVARVVLQDFTGVPLLCDLACDAQRDAQTSARIRR